ncbi:MAG: MOSC domain-containing protein [Rhodospirillales bacterium]
MTITVDAIYRYPVKGLSAQKLDRVRVRAGEMLPFDRAFALALGAGAFDPAFPRHMPKTNFLMLLRDEKLAALEASFEPDSQTLAIVRNGRKVASGKLDDAMGRAVIEQFFAAYMGAAARGQPKLVSAPNHNFSDVDAKALSLINLASVKDLERVTAAPVHPLRFRANVYFAGAPAWAENAWPGKEIAIGKLRLGVIKRIQRCAATHVNPETAARDMNVVRALQRGFGHADMGIYARVLDDGEIARGDALTPP